MYCESFFRRKVCPFGLFKKSLLSLNRKLDERES